MNSGRNFENAIAYLHGRIEKEIEGFAQSLGVPTEILTSRLADLLRASGARGENQMSLVRLPSQQHQRPTTREVESVGHARDGLQKASSSKGGITPKGRRRLAALMKKRWRSARKNGKSVLPKAA